MFAHLGAAALGGGRMDLPRGFLLDVQSLGGFVQLTGLLAGGGGQLLHN